MGRLKWRNLAAVLLALALLPLPPAWAGSVQTTEPFTVTISKTSGEAGSTVRMTLAYHGAAKVSAFLLELRLGGSWTVTGSKFEQEGYLFSSSYDGMHRWVYTQEKGAGLPAGTLMTADLKLSKEASGPVDLQLDLRQITFENGGNAADIPFHLVYEVLPPPGNEANLTMLQPSEGSLTPDFSPDVEEYQVSVPFSVTEMFFEAQVPPGAKWSVNRKNLGAGGSETLFQITVTAENGKDKRVYTVTVHREPKPTAPTPTPKPSPSPKPDLTPKATGTPKAAATPKATKTPKPTATPKPTKTPKPSATPKPSKTPKPTGSPKPAAENTGPQPSPAGDPLADQELDNVRVVTVPVPVKTGGDGWVTAVGLGGLGIFAGSRLLESIQTLRGRGPKDKK